MHQSLFFLTLVACLLTTGCVKDSIQSMPCITTATEDPSDHIIYGSQDVDQPPLYDLSCCGQEDLIGCSQSALANALASTIRYPAEARENGIQGRVEIKFVVEKDGSLSSFEVLQGIGGGCEEEVIDVVMATSPWSPAIHMGHYVRAYRTLSMTFELQ